MTKDVLDPFAKGLPKPLQNRAEAPTIGAEEVGVGNDRNDTVVGVATAHVPGCRVHLPFLLREILGRTQRIDAPQKKSGLPEVRIRPCHFITRIEV
jgi:hypothetical protein